MSTVQIKFRFERGQDVVVARSGKDPGGRGVVTAREYKEDDRGPQVLYRVFIANHDGPARAAASGGRNDGFWYKDELVKEVM